MRTNALKLMALVGFVMLLSNFKATAQIDTLSYAAGYLMTREAMGDSAMHVDQDSCKEFLRGFNEQCLDDSTYADPTFMPNYLVGQMQGVFMLSALTNGTCEVPPNMPIECLADGMMTVAQGKLNLPTDTIEAKRIMRHMPKGKLSDVLDSIPAEERCSLLKSIGIMNAMAPGIQDYIDQLMGDKTVAANRETFARGMADMLLVTSGHDTPYDIGRMLAASVNSFFLPKLSNGRQFHPKKADLIAGIEAALGLKPLAIDVATMEAKASVLKETDDSSEVDSSDPTSVE